MLWRWDQGRLDYFRFESIRLIAKSLVPLNGVSVNAPSGDLLRNPLQQGTGLPFAPARYRVWRNYARVFRAAGLATSIGDALVVTDLCRALARDGEESMAADDYLAFLTPRFYFPSPAFDGWSDGAQRVYPFCAILKHLLNHRRTDGFAAITVRQVFGFLIGNGCTGNEPLDHYARLTDTGLTPTGDQGRQVRELLLFLSQFAFLQWSAPNTLYLDMDAFDVASHERILRMATPSARVTERDRDQEIIKLAEVPSIARLPFMLPGRELIADDDFVEGRRVRRNHLTIERSPKLRRLFFAANPTVPPCDMCRQYMQRRYPWTVNILEIHHVLPLASSLRVEATGVRLSDIVPLCPNCHRSVHVYYSRYLDDERLADFDGVDEASRAYSRAKALLG